MVTFIVSKPTDRLSASRLEFLYARYGANIWSGLLADQVD